VPVVASSRISLGVSRQKSFKLLKWVPARSFEFAPYLFCSRHIFHIFWVPAISFEFPPYLSYFFQPYLSNLFPPYLCIFFPPKSNTDTLELEALQHRLQLSNDERCERTMAATSHYHRLSARIYHHNSIITTTT